MTRRWELIESKIDLLQASMGQLLMQINNTRCQPTKINDVKSKIGPEKKSRIEPEKIFAIDDADFEGFPEVHMATTTAITQQTTTPNSFIIR